MLRVTPRLFSALLSGLILLVTHAGVARADHGNGGGNGGGETEINGTIESLPANGLIGDWTVSGQTVHVTSSTDVRQEHGPAVVGAPVEVRGTSEADGSIDASRVEVEGTVGGGDDGGNGGGDDGGGDDNGGGGDDNPGDDNGGGHGGDDGPGDDNGGDHDGDDDGTGHDANEIHGTVESLPESGLIGDWVVSGRTVHVTDATVIEQEHGAVAVGATVEAHGTAEADGSLTATRIEVNPTNGGGGETGGHAKVFGTVEALPADGVVGTWTVSGRAVIVSDTTTIEYEHGVTVAVGSRVEAEGSQLADGSLAATKVEVRTDGSSTPGSGSDDGGGMSSGFSQMRAQIESLPATGLIGEWTVGGRTVLVTDATTIKKASKARVGATVDVRGNGRPDGSLDANRIEVKKGGGGSGASSFYGNVEALPADGLVGEWTVNGRTVLVDASTSVDQEHGSAAVGAYVEVKGATNASGQFAATRIEVKSNGGVGSSGYIEFRGTVESLPVSGLVGTWTVSGRTVIVAESTSIRTKHGAVHVGGAVEIEGNQRSDGTVDAVKVGTED